MALGGRKKRVDTVVKKRSGRPDADGEEEGNRNSSEDETESVLSRVLPFLPLLLLLLNVLAIGLSLRRLLDFWFRTMRARAFAATSSSSRKPSSDPPTEPWLSLLPSEVALP